MELLKYVFLRFRLEKIHCAEGVVTHKIKYMFKNV